MMKSILVCLLLLSPALMFGQRKEVAELQRDVMLLQDSVRVLQRTLDEKMETLLSLTQKSLDNSSSQNTAVTMMDSTLQERVREMQRTMGTPVANLNNKVDQLANEMQYLRETMVDINRRITTMERTLLDVSTAVNTMPPPPPGAASMGAPTGSTPSADSRQADTLGSAAAMPGARPSPLGTAPAKPAAGVSAASLYENARRDKARGNFDLAIMQFDEYLTNFPGSDSAPTALYQIGEIHYIRKDYEKALASFDGMLERFPENSATPLGMYMKGMTLVKMGQRTKGAEEFRALIKRFPNDEYTPKARVQLQQMGLR
ncbi:MAG: outer membrane protein assembly factor BamD [Bryobacterales bacterium]|nr:outer membrane protein assembly factor BamD [Bryobacterales bacterium]